MADRGPSLAQRALAVVILAVVALVVARLVIGAITAVFWIVVLLALAVAALWAMSTLRSARRGRAVRKGRGRAVAAPPPEDPVEAQMRKIQQQLREQGRG